LGGQKCSRWAAGQIKLILDVFVAGGKRRRGVDELLDPGGAPIGGVVVRFRLVVVFLRWVKSCRIGGSKVLAVGCRSNRVDITCCCGWGQAEEGCW
jgi:hypothetical protein